MPPPPSLSPLCLTPFSPPDPRYRIIPGVSAPTGSFPAGSSTSTPLGSCTRYCRKREICRGFFPSRRHRRRGNGTRGGVRTAMGRKSVVEWVPREGGWTINEIGSTHRSGLHPPDDEENKRTREEKSCVCADHPSFSRGRP